MAAFNVEQKKKLARDEAHGMSEDTRRHFERVKRNMFAFVDQQHRMGVDRSHLASPISLRRHRQQPSADQNKERKPQAHHHRTPGHRGNQFQAPEAVHRRLSHLILATPQAARRLGK